MEEECRRRRNKGGERSLEGIIRRGVEKDFGRALSIGQREEFCVWH
jgi:hypothetical protein